MSSSTVKKEPQALSVQLSKLAANVTVWRFQDAMREAKVDRDQICRCNVVVAKLLRYQEYFLLRIVSFYFDNDDRLCLGVRPARLTSRAVVYGRRAFPLPRHAPLLHGCCEL